MRTLTIAALALALTAAACGSKDADLPPPVALRPQVLKDIPKLPQSILTDTTGAVDAEQQKWIAQLPFDSVARFYRGQLPALGWQVMGDRGDSAVLDLHGRKGDQAVWVHIVRLGSLATEYTLIGTQGPGEPGTPVPER
jgi:hypothetical protein